MTRADEVADRGDGNATMPPGVANELWFRLGEAADEAEAVVEIWDGTKSGSSWKRQLPECELRGEIKGNACIWLFDKQEKYIPSC